MAEEVRADGFVADLWKPYHAAWCGVQKDGDCTCIPQEERMVPMPERFEDMVLKDPLETLLAKDFKTAYSGHLEEFRNVALAQHEADMAHEIACPCACHNWEYISCMAGICACSGTGRVTLGALVAADRAQKAVP